MPRLTLRDYQEECVQAHFDWFARNREGNPLFVVPTGGGKSLIIAEFIRRTLHAWPKTRFIVLTHVKELIEQNHAEFVSHWGEAFAPAGIYSAGLGQRDTTDRVLFAGIQSVYDRAHTLGSFDLVLVDEAHLVPKSGQGRYRHYLEQLRKINPRVRVCGYTATHFRLDGGYLHKGDGSLFTDVAYEVHVDLLIEQGHLVPLMAKKPGHVIDTAAVRSGHGDFKLNDLEDVATGDGCVEAAVTEATNIGIAAGRRSWLVFAITVKHAEQIVAALRAQEIDVEAIYGHTPRDERDRLTARFRDGHLTALVNVGVLTTGFNAPRCDLLIVMRPTQSAALYVQMMGRGMRTFPGKTDCLVLDYGCNVERHGPINKVRPKRAGEGDGAAPVKVCPQCQSIVLLGVDACPDCGFVFPKREVAAAHDRQASELAPYDPDANKPRVYEVDSWFFRRHQKDGRPDSLRVDYFCGTRTLSEWVCLEHPGFAGKKAARWWTGHRGLPPIPATIDDALQRTEELRAPDAIEVVADGEFDRVHRSLYRGNDEPRPDREQQQQAEQPAIDYDDVPF